jgi:para-aminobenzoate synthetase component 1
MTSPVPKSSGLTILPVDCFVRMARRPGAVWLDSSLARDDWGRYSLLATDPVDRLVSTGEGDLQPIMDELESIRCSQDRYAIGYVGYEATLPWLGLRATVTPPVPHVHFMVYDRVLRYDHTAGTYSNPYLALRLLDTCPTPRRVTFDDRVRFAPTVSRASYLDKVRRIQRHIHEGDIYQANLTCRVDAFSQADPFAVYLRMRRLNRAAYSAYMNFGDCQVLSSSPERMFHWENGKISSSPIKGTIGRDRDTVADLANRSKLAHSAKDRAELLMIVDLVRNDLGRIARTGTVTVRNLYRIEQLSSLYHLVADITAETMPDLTIGKLFAALLPGGSITGAPKRRAVEVLSGIEESPRSVYTGCIGYVGGGRADFNIAIRTMVHENGCYRIHAGGGIVADSDPEAEYDEMLLKAKNLIKAVEGDR